MAANTCILRFLMLKENMLLNCQYIDISIFKKQSLVASVTKKVGLCRLLTHSNQSNSASVFYTLDCGSGVHCWKEFLFCPHLELEIIVDSTIGVFTSSSPSSFIQVPNLPGLFPVFFFSSLPLSFSLPFLLLPSLPFSLSLIHSFIHQILVCARLFTKSSGCIEFL